MTERHNVVEDAAVADLFQQVQAAQEDPELALSLCDRILQLCPDDPDALRCKVAALALDSQFDEALEAIDRSSELDFDLEKAYCLYKGQRYADCMHLTAQHSELPGFAELRAQTLYRTGEYAKAAELFAQLEREDQPEQDPDELRANRLAAEVQTELTRAEAEELAAGPQQIYDVMFNVACMLASCGMFAGAEPKLHEAMSQAEQMLIGEGCSAEQVEDECAAFKVQLGYVMQMQHRPEQAMQLYQQALRDKPSDPQVVIVANNNCIALKQYSELFDSHKKAKAAASAEMDDKLTLEQKQILLINHVLLLLFMNKTDSSREQLSAYEKKYGEDQHTCLLRSALLWREKKTVKAEQLLAEYIAQASMR